MKVTAPDPDGARYSALRLADPGCHVLVRLYDHCRSMGRAPQDWKDSTTVLVHKGGDRDVLHNWRTMMLSNTIGKLYSPVLADRISKWATDGGRLSPEQKSLPTTRDALNIILSSKRKLKMRGDVGKGCVLLGSTWPMHLARYPIPTFWARCSYSAEMLTIVADLYTDSVIRALTPDGLSDPIPILSGVK